MRHLIRKLSSSPQFIPLYLLLIGLLCLFSSTGWTAVLFEPDYRAAAGDLNGQGRVEHQAGGVLLRGGSQAGQVTTRAIDARGHSNLRLSLYRQASRLGSGGRARIEIAVNGGPFRVLDAVGNSAGTVALDLPPAADNAGDVILRFSIDGGSLLSTLNVRDIRLEGMANGGLPPTPPPGTDTGETRFWELQGNLGSHDPTIMEERGIWYQFQTGPGIYRKISFDGGITWDPLPSVFRAGLPWWRSYVPGQQGTDVWAPEVRAFNGRVWMFYSISTFGSNRSVIGLASSPSLAADNWRDHGAVISTSTSDNFNAIDPDLVIDAEGNPWLAFGSFWSGIKLTRLDPQTMKPVGNLHSLASRSEGIEAPTIVYRGGYYYLFVSVGRCCNGVNSTYLIAYGRSRAVTGPYLDREGRNLLNGGGSVLDAGNERWRGPGGQDIHRMENGTWVIARHAYDVTDNGASKLLISNLNWTVDGWPVY